MLSKVKFFQCALILCGAFLTGNSQNSMLVNFGANNCSSSTDAGFSFIKNPLGANPVLLSECPMTSQMPNYFSVFIAYNPKNNKIYVADIRTGLETKIWLLDIGLPGSIGCPASIPVSPNYSYNYISNNFEFDNNGDLWSFSNYDPALGQCNLDKFDVNTGQVINTRRLQFPAGNIPGTISSGDLCILPNGRMFATLGSGPSRLYEIINYSSTATATANFLTTLPRDCYGIAFINGILEITGNDFFSQCYYFDYNISSGVLGPQKPFQAGQSPIDNTSFTPAIGCTKKLVGATQVNSNTYDLIYEIYAENMGNVILNNISLSDDLGAVFGAGNVSNVSAAFVPGSNAAALSLNPAYNGTNNINLLLPGQNLPNRILNNRNHNFRVRISFRASGLNAATTYNNNAVCSGNIGSDANNSLAGVSDISNNGDSTQVDPNKNGVANETGENNPTPFSFSLVPVKFLGLSARMRNLQDAEIRWQVATPMENAATFTIEHSTDGLQWQALGSLPVTDRYNGTYSHLHNRVTYTKGYYRIRQTDHDGAFIYSNTVALRRQQHNQPLTIAPNPADGFIQVSGQMTHAATVMLELFDMGGRKLYAAPYAGGSVRIPADRLPDGCYALVVRQDSEHTVQKVIIRH
jgi:hypothetical protein